MLSERRQKGIRSLELIQNGQVPLNVTKLFLFFFCFDTHTDILWTDIRDDSKQF